MNRKLFFIRLGVIVDKMHNRKLFAYSEIKIQSINQAKYFLFMFWLQIAPEVNPLLSELRKNIFNFFFRCNLV